MKSGEDGASSINGENEVKQAAKNMKRVIPPRFYFSLPWECNPRLLLPAAKEAALALRGIASHSGPQCMSRLQNLKWPRRFLPTF